MRRIQVSHWFYCRYKALVMKTNQKSPKSSKPRNVKHQRKGREQKESHGSRAIYTLPGRKIKNSVLFLLQLFSNACVLNCTAEQRVIVCRTRPASQLTKPREASLKLKLLQNWMVTASQPALPVHSPYTGPVLWCWTLAAMLKEQFELFPQKDKVQSASLRTLVWDTICWRSFQFK